MMLTTGMSMFGKISVGVRTIASIPIIRISIAITTKVYGRRNASRTIHMEYRSFSSQLPTDRQLVVRDLVIFQSAALQHRVRALANDCVNPVVRETALHRAAVPCSAPENLLPVLTHLPQLAKP